VIAILLFTWWFVFGREVPGMATEPRSGTAVATAGNRKLVSVAGLNGHRGKMGRAIRQMVDTADPNTYVVGMAKVPMSLLALASSFKMINKLFGTALSTRDVKALLTRGADARAQSPEEGTTALFSAVSYADPEAIQELLAAGADVHAQDSTRMFTSGQTALYNAAFAGNHGSVQLLLDAGAETTPRLFEALEKREGRRVQLLFKCNAAEAMLVVGGQSAPPSWQHIGRPSVAKWVKTFELLLAHGALIGPGRPGVMAKVGNAAHERRNPGAGILSALDLALGAVVLGTDYQGRCASGARPTWDSASAPPRRSDGAIPDADHGAVVDLLSGQGFGEAPSGSAHRQTFSQQMLAYMGARVDRGTAHMTEAQLRAECSALGLRLLWGGRARMEVAIRAHDAKTTKAQGKAPYHLEVGNCATVTNDKRNFVVCPANGARGCFVKASRDLTADPVAVFAFLSTTSPYTVMSKALADRLGVLRSNLKSKSGFVDACGGKLACDLVREVTVTVGDGVSVVLKTAVVVHNFVRGLQLGMDFFLQAERCVLDVLVGGKPALLHTLLPARGSGDFVIRSGSAAADTPETMRFHALGGATAIVPLVPCHDHIGLCAVAVAGKIKMQVCDWCGRPFPGLKRCLTCAEDGVTVSYCSSACQEAAWPEHKQTAPHRNRNDST